MRLRIFAIGAILALDACAPVIHPPAAPPGFLNPPRTTYAGVLSRDGVAAIGPGAPPSSAPQAGMAQTIEIDYLDGNRASIHVGPTCVLPAAVLSPPYLEVPGIGFTRQVEGTLSLEAGAGCALEGGTLFTLLAGSAAVRGAGLLDITAAGRDDRGLPGSMRFTGLLANAREIEPVAPAKTVKVHLLAELVSSCSTCRFNHRPLSERGQFPFEPKLEQQSSTPAGPTWTPVCGAPCAAAIDPSVPLRVAGAGLLDSTPFFLPAGRPRIVLKASSSGTAARAFGWTFVGAAAAYVVSGATMLAVGTREPTQTAHDRSTALGLELGGGGFLLGSLGFLIPGLIVLAHDGTAVTTDAGETLAAP
jgi:hypothetical protein